MIMVLIMCENGLVSLQQILPKTVMAVTVPVPQDTEEGEVQSQWVCSANCHLELSGIPVETANRFAYEVT